jgi:hypothetical protein
MYGVIELDWTDGNGIGMYGVIELDWTEGNGSAEVHIACLAILLLCWRKEGFSRTDDIHNPCECLSL